MQATIYSYLRQHATELGARILEIFPPLQSMTDKVPSEMATLLRKALPAQAIAIAGLAKYLKTARSARIVAECGTGKTFMSLGLAHVFASENDRGHVPFAHIQEVGAEAVKAIPHVRTFLIEDMRSGGDPKQLHGLCEVRLKGGRVVYEGMKTSMQEICLRLMGRKMLVALMMEGKFSGEGLQSLDADEDLMSAMARELVEKAALANRPTQSGSSWMRRGRVRWSMMFQRPRNKRRMPRGITIPSPVGTAIAESTRCILAR
jgi:hypothetical protein